MIITGNPFPQYVSYGVGAAFALPSGLDVPAFAAPGTRGSPRLLLFRRHDLKNWNVGRGPLASSSHPQATEAFRGDSPDRQPDNTASRVCSIPGDHGPLRRLLPDGCPCPQTTSISSHFLRPDYRQQDRPRNTLRLADSAWADSRQAGDCASAILFLHQHLAWPQRTQPLPRFSLPLAASSGCLAPRGAESQETDRNARYAAHPRIRHRRHQSCKASLGRRKRSSRYPSDPFKSSGTR